MMFAINLMLLRGQIKLLWSSAIYIYIYIYIVNVSLCCSVSSFDLSIFRLPRNSDIQTLWYWESSACKSLTAPSIRKHIYCAPSSVRRSHALRITSLKLFWLDPLWSVLHWATRFQLDGFLGSGFGEHVSPHMKQCSLKLKGSISDWRDLLTTESSDYWLCCAKYIFTWCLKHNPYVHIGLLYEQLDLGHVPPNQN